MGKLIRFPQERCTWPVYHSASGKMLRFRGHKWKHCESGCRGCMFCEGGISACTVCGGGEASLPTHCPGGPPMSWRLQELVMQGHVDYRRDTWVAMPDGDPIELIDVPDVEPQDNFKFKPLEGLT